MTKSRKWTVTLWLDCPCQLCAKYLDPTARFDDLNIKYTVWQNEACPNTGRYHSQVYVIFNTSYNLQFLKRNYCERAHFEIAKGTFQQNYDYCTKDVTRVPDTNFQVAGEPPAQGRRTDIQALHLMVQEQRPFREIAESHFHAFIRYNRGIRDAMNLYRPVRTEPCFTTVFWGRPGSGKTKRALHLGGEDAYWLAAPNGNNGQVWWDGYEGQATVIIDEFYGWIPLNFMNRLCDRYPMQVQTKGGNVPFSTTRIIITSNVHPNEWWPRTFARTGNLGAMERRLTHPSGEIVEMNEPGVWCPPPALVPLPLSELIVSDPIDDISPALLTCYMCGAGRDSENSMCLKCIDDVLSSQPIDSDEPIANTVIEISSDNLEGSSADEEPNSEDIAFINESATSSEYDGNFFSQC